MLGKLNGCRSFSGFRDKESKQASDVPDTALTTAVSSV